MIAIDFVGTASPSGSKTYIINFCQELLKKKISNKKIIIFILENYLNHINIKDKPDNIVIIKKSNFFSNTIARQLWIQILLPLSLLIRKQKILFSPMNISPMILRFLKIKNVLTLHSNLPWIYFNLMPGTIIKKFLIKFFMTYSVLNCDYLIVNSNYAKREIISKLNISKKKIFMIYLGLEDNLNLNVKKLSKKNNNYFLSILSCTKYHNILNLLKAYKLFISKTNKKINYKIFMQILDRNYLMEIKNYLKKNKLNNKIKIYLPQNRSKLKRIYNNAYAYIFTSYSEVFGYSTIEAMKFKLPVLTSNKSALKEINSDSALYFDPDNINEISNQMIRISSDKTLRKKLIEKGTKNIKRFCRNENFTKTMNLILKISDKSHHKN